MVAFTGSDIGGSITTGGTAQVFAAAGSIVHGFSIYNPDLTNSLYVSEFGTAAPNAQGSFALSPGGYYETPQGYRPSNAISIVGSVTGQKFTAKKW